MASQKKFTNRFDAGADSSYSFIGVCFCFQQQLAVRPSIKYFTTIILSFFLCSLSYGQSKQKDTTIKADTTICISLTEINETLNFLYDKATAKQLEEAKQYFLLLYQRAAANKPKKKGK